MGGCKKTRRQYMLEYKEELIKTCKKNLIIEKLQIVLEAYIQML